MNTITLTPEAYHYAFLSAQKVKTSVEDWVNKVLLSFVTSAVPTTPTKEDEKKAKVSMYSWDEMAGMFASDKSDQELLDEYLDDKYGI